MTGTIYKIAKQGSFCFIKSGVQTFYAHERDFDDPSIMQVGQEVEFRPKLKGLPGKPHPVTDVVAIQRQAA